MDRDIRDEWLKEPRMKSLSGVSGSKKMAQDMLRAESEAARDTYENKVKTSLIRHGG